MVLDIILLLILVIGFILGLQKGLFVEIGTIAGIILGVWGAVAFSESLSIFLENYLNKKYVQLISFILLFVGIMFFTSIISKSLTKVFQSMNLGGAVRLLGGFFGLLKWAVMLSIFINIFDFFNLALDIAPVSTLEKSFLYNPLKEIAIFIIPKLKQVLNI